MTELELSIMAPTPESTFRTVLQQLLDQFEAEQHICVRPTIIPWMEGWTELVKIALYGHGPDVSEVGTTWVSSLVGMNALLPLARRELQAIGEPTTFLPSAWQSVSLAGGPEVWAVPWLAGTRLLFYRRDLLAKAGVDEPTAFQTHEQLEQTLQRLWASGVTSPWVVPTRHTLNTLHYVASWVWGAGGSFVAANGRRPAFHEENARRGLGQYFGLGRYLPQPAYDLDDTQAETLFWQGKAVVTVGGQWVPSFYEKNAAPEVIDNLGITLVPGVSFVGGSNLVIWKHTRRMDAALQLIRFLTGHQAQVEYSTSVGLLPARIGALEAERFVSDPVYQVASQGLKTGRSFPSIRLWGLVEDKLTATLAQIWADVLATPQPDIGSIVGSRLDPLAGRLGLALNPS